MIRYISSCFLASDSSFATSLFTPDMNPLTESWTKQHQAYDFSVQASYMSCLWAFLNEKSALSCDLIQWKNCWATRVARPLFSIFGYCHYWLCWACTSAWWIWLETLCVKIFQQNQRIKEIACLNQQVLGDGCNSQITETKLKEQSVFGNQLICFSNTILMLETLHLWPTNHPWAFMFSLY